MKCQNDSQDNRFISSFIFIIPFWVGQKFTYSMTTVSLNSLEYLKKNNVIVIEAFDKLIDIM